MGLVLEIIKNLSVMEVGMREYSVDSSAHAAKLGHRGLLDADSAREILVTVQKTGCSIQSVSRKGV